MHGRIVKAVLASLLFSAAAAYAAGDTTGREARANYFDDPFLQVTNGISGCPVGLAACSFASPPAILSPSFPDREDIPVLEVMPLPDADSGRTCYEIPSCLSQRASR